MIMLSVDFDWFVRERCDWDWGHAETGDTTYLWFAWVGRYLTMDVASMTNPDRYADFPPEQIWERLERMGLRINGTVVVGESHADAKAVFEVAGGGTIIHLDAHTDMYNTRRSLDCGNWLSHLVLENPKKYGVIYVPPRWLVGEFESEEQLRKEIRESVPPAVREKMRFFEIKFFDELQISGEVGAVYVAHSGAWTPPHLDVRFRKMLDAGKERGLVVSVERWVDRTQLLPEIGIRVREDGSIDASELAEQRRKIRSMEREFVMEAMEDGERADADRHVRGGK